MLILPMLFGAFRPPKADNGGPAIPLDETVLSRPSVVGLLRLKTPSSMGKMNIAEVLRLRATSAVSRDQSVRRFAQDDDSVGEPTERRPLGGAGANCGSLGSSQDDDSWENQKRTEGRSTALRSG